MAQPVARRDRTSSTFGKPWLAKGAYTDVAPDGRIQPDMHVLILNQYATPSGDAGITRHGEIGAEMVRHGHRVTIVASAFDYLSRQRVQRPTSVAGVQFVWLETGTYRVNDASRVRSMVLYAFRAFWSARRAKPQVIIGSSPHLLTPLAAWAAARLLRVPFVLEVRDFWPAHMVDLGAVRAGSATHRLLEALERFLYHRADGVVTVPPRGSLRASELGISDLKWTHIPNVPTTLAPAADRKSDGFTVLYAGAHGVANDLGIVTDAARLLPEVRFLLVGAGQQRDALMAQAPPNVEFRRAVPKSDMPAVLAEAHAGLVHLAPATVFRYGLSPNKMWDYFAAGIPVLIASRYPTPVDEHGAGLRYEPGSAPALVEAVRAIMSTSERERREMGERGRRLVDTEYSMARITDRYEALLRTLIAEHGH
jgi:glycosyltransferase involved in cell wall biosynthesis